MAWRRTQSAPDPCVVEYLGDSEHPCITRQGNFREEANFYRTAPANDAIRRAHNRAIGRDLNLEALAAICTRYHRRELLRHVLSAWERLRWRWRAPLEALGTVCVFNAPGAQEA